MTIATLNPSTGKVEKTFAHLTEAEIERALERADKAATALRASSVGDRIKWLKATAQILRDESDTFAALMTREMGKTYAAAIAEAQKCATVCDYYAEHGEALLADKHIKTEAELSFVRYLPLGPVLAVMPWNYPFWQVFRFAAPAILAGNPGLLKHASNVPQCALAISDIFKRAGLPDGGFQTLLISGDQVERVLTDERVKAATLTGSEAAGRAVAEIAGKMLKPMVLELGGSDPFIVMPSANLDLAVSKAIEGRTKNNGQSCIAAKRFIVHADVYDAFRSKFAAAMDDLVVGDPMDERTDIGPLSTEAIRSELIEQIEKTLAMGAKRINGGTPIEGAGWYFKPGLLEDIPKGSPAFEEELFGPVGTLFKVTSLQEAIELANATRFGLGSSVFTTDHSDIERAFSKLDAGATFINDITSSDPRLPFGGIGASGHGRELAEEGLRAFMNVKTCVLKFP